MVINVNVLLAAVSGFSLALAFPYPSISLLAWVGFVPLFFALKRSGLTQAPLVGFVAGAAFFTTVLYWIQVFGYIAWLLLSISLSSAFVIFATGAWLVMRRYAGLGQFIVIPALWAATESLRAFGPWGFAWAHLGSTVEYPLLLKFASYVGELGLGAFVMLVNLILFNLVDGTGARVRLRRVALGVSVAAVALAPVVWFGSVAPSLFEPHSPDVKPPAVRIAVLQPNLAQELKADVTNNDAIKARYLAMTKDALNTRHGMPPDIIVWPESTLITHIEDEPEFIKEVAALLRPTKTALIFGGVEGVGDANYNTAFYLDESGGLNRYRKIHLVPFGEFVPLRPLVERVNSMATLVNDYARGSEYTVFKTSGPYNFSAVICFESSQTGLVGRMVREGAELLIVVTNDAWFGKTAAAEQHFRITRMRAAEYGIPVVQAANTGISGFIGADGTVVRSSGLGERAILRDTAVLSGGKTFYSRAGLLFVYVFMLVSVVGVGLAALQSRRPEWLDEKN